MIATTSFSSGCFCMTVCVWLGMKNEFVSKEENKKNIFFFLKKTKKMEKKEE